MTYHASSVSTIRTRERRLFLQCAAMLGAGFAGRGASAAETSSRASQQFAGLSLATYSFRRHMDWSRGKRSDGKLSMLGFVELCAKLGFDAAELTGYFFPKPLTASYINRLKRRAFLLGLDISGGAIGNDFGHPPNSARGQKEIAETKNWIDRYADLGAPAIRIFASRSRPQDSTDAQVVQNVTACLEQVLPYAEKRGVMLGLENHDFATNLDYLLQILSSVDSQWLGVTWDSANLAPTRDPYADLARIARHAITAQIKVTTRRDGKPEHADYAKLLAILKAADYRGYIVLEYEESEDAYQAVPRFADDVRSTIAKMAAGD